jgi:hypothetical protein
MPSLFERFMSGVKPKNLMENMDNQNAPKSFLFDNLIKRQYKQLPYTEANNDNPISPELIELLNKIKQSGNLEDNSPTIRPSQFIKPYYGAKYDEELEKARAYFNSKFPVIEGTNRRSNNMANYDLNATEPYSGLERPVRVTTEENTPIPYTNLNQESGKPAGSSNYIKWEDGSDAMQIKTFPMPSKSSDAWVMEQSKLSPDKQILSAAEHEAGHSAYMGGLEKSPVEIDSRKFFPKEKPDGPNRTKMEKEWDEWGSHIADRREVTNGLGRLQRETFALTGSRITDKAGLEKILKKIDPKIGASGLIEYSPDARRTLDLLYRAKTNKLHKQNEGMYKDLIDLIPSFVSNKSYKDNRA